MLPCRRSRRDPRETAWLAHSCASSDQGASIYSSVFQHPETSLDFQSHTSLSTKVVLLVTTSTSVTKSEQNWRNMTSVIEVSHAPI